MASAFSKPLHSLPTWSEILTSGNAAQVNLARTVCKATEVSPDCQERLDHLVPTVPKVSKVYLDPVDLTVWEWKDQLDHQDPKDLPDLPASASPADPVSVVIPANQVIHLFFFKLTNGTERHFVHFRCAWWSR